MDAGEVVTSAACRSHRKAPPVGDPGPRGCTIRGPRSMSSIPPVFPELGSGLREYNCQGSSPTLPAWREAEPVLHSWNISERRAASGVGCLSLEMSKRHHPDLFLKWAWKMFRGRFIFASGLLPDRDCIFWENVLADFHVQAAARSIKVMVHVDKVHSVSAKTDHHVLPYFCHPDVLTTWKQSVPK